VFSTAPEHHPSKLCLDLISRLSSTKEKANSLFKEDKFEEALSLYSEALEIDKFHAKINAKLFCNKAACFLKLGKFEEAIEASTKAIELDKGYQKAFLRRAQAFIESEEFVKAVKDYQHLIRLDTSNSEYKKLLNEAAVKLQQSKNKDFYTTIGVSKTATIEEIKKAYRKAALVHHPDRHSLAEESKKQMHLKKFKEISEAYGVLSDPEKRKLYDQGRLYQSIQASYNADVIAKAFAAAQMQQQQARAAAAAAAGAGLAGVRPGVGGLGGLPPGFVFIPGAGGIFTGNRIYPNWNMRRGFM